MERFIINSVGPDDEGLRKAFEWLVDAASSHSDRSGAVYVSGLSAIDSLERALGGEIGTMFRRDRAIRGSDFTIELVLRRTRPSWLTGPVLVPWANPTLIGEAESMRPSAIAVTGWADGELDEWMRVHAPIDLETMRPIVEREEPSNALRGAIEDLTFGISDDILHPSDRGRAIRSFRALQMTGAGVDHVMIQAIALDLGWEPAAAARLSKLAKQIADGGSPRGGGRLSKTDAASMVRGFEASQRS